MVRDGHCSTYRRQAIQPSATPRPLGAGGVVLARRQQSGPARGRGTGFRSDIDLLDDVEVVIQGLAIHERHPPVVSRLGLGQLVRRDRFCFGGVLQKLPVVVRPVVLDRDDRGL